MHPYTHFCLSPGQPNCIFSRQKIRNIFLSEKGYRCESEKGYRCESEKGTVVNLTKGTVVNRVCKVSSLPLHSLLSTSYPAPSTLITSPLLSCPLPYLTPTFFNPCMFVCIVNVWFQVLILISYSQISE